MGTGGMTDPRELQRKLNDYEGVMFLGTVADNNDPEQRGRLRVSVPNLYGKVETANLPWASPVIPYGQGPAGGVAALAVPVVGSLAVIVLQEGDPYHPLYLGGILNASSLPSHLKANYPNRYGMQDAKGNTLFVDTETGDVEVEHFTGMKVVISPEGDMLVEGPKDLTMIFGSNVSLNAGGNVSVECSGSVSVQAQGEVTVRGTTIRMN